MAVPALTSASVVQTPNSGGTSATLNIPISASGNDRLVFIAGVSKDNSSTVNVLSTMVFDATGVNLSVGAGITQAATRQIAQEGNFSSQSDVYVIKEADLPSSAGTYAIDITMDGSVQYLYWIAFEVTGCNQTLDATAVASGVSNVSAGGSYSLNSTGMTPGTLITTTVADCLLIDFWGQSDSAAPGISPGTGQIQIGSNFSNTNGGGNCSYKAATTAGSYNMSQTTTTLSQRQAGIVVSIAPPAASGIVVSPTAVSSIAGKSEPSAVLGSIITTPSIATVIAGLATPTVVYGSLSLIPSAVSAVAAIIAPTVLEGGGLIIVPGAVSSVGAVVTPNTILGSLTIAPAPSTVTGAVVAPKTILGSISIIPGAVSSISGLSDPTSILGSVNIVPNPVTGVASRGNPVVLIDGVSPTTGPENTSGMNIRRYMNTRRGVK